MSKFDTLIEQLFNGLVKEQSPQQQNRTQTYMQAAEQMPQAVTPGQKERVESDAKQTMQQGAQLASASERKKRRAIQKSRADLNREMPG